MLNILVTQRVEIDPQYGERRDALDQRWTRFLAACHIFPTLVPNFGPLCLSILEKGSIDGILLTGGNSLVKYGGFAEERDDVEKRLLAFAIEHHIPVLGICRGMQVIQDFFGIPLVPVTNHVKMRHTLHVEPIAKLVDFLGQLTSVNSFHEFGTYEDCKDLLSTSKSQDSVVMSLEHNTLPIYGCMWHPEREEPWNPVDQRIVQWIFSKNWKKGTERESNHISRR